MEVESALPNEAHREPQGLGTSHSPMTVERMLLTEIQHRILGRCVSNHQLHFPILLAQLERFARLVVRSTQPPSK